MAKTFENPTPPTGPTSQEVQTIIQTIKEKK